MTSQPSCHLVKSGVTIELWGKEDLRKASENTFLLDTSIALFRRYFEGRSKLCIFMHIGICSRESVTHCKVLSIMHTCPGYPEALLLQERISDVYYQVNVI